MALATYLLPWIQRRSRAIARTDFFRDGEDGLLLPARADSAAPTSDALSVSLRLRCRHNEYASRSENPFPIHPVGGGEDSSGTPAVPPRTPVLWGTRAASSHTSGGACAIEPQLACLEAIARSLVGDAMVRTGGPTFMVVSLLRESERDSHEAWPCRGR